MSDPLTQWDENRKERRGDTAFFRPIAPSPTRRVLFSQEFPMSDPLTKWDENSEWRVCEYVSVG